MRENALLSCPATALALFLLVGCSRNLMPTPNLYVGAEADPFAGVPEPFQQPWVDILYATDRVPETKDDGSLAYTAGRSRSLAFGTARVHIGRDLTWAQLVELSRQHERPYNTELKLGEINEVGRFPETPLPLKLIDGRAEPDPDLVAAQQQTEAQLQQMVDDRLAQTPRKEVFLFVHGFNNRFEHAAFRIAELWHFLGREGVPVAYSWPAGSGGGFLRSYLHDRESSEFTVYHFKQFVMRLAKNGSVDRIHVIAHSRGTDVLVTALREIHIELRASGHNTRKLSKLGNVVLVAADLDFQVVRQRISTERVQLMPQRLTVYRADTDQAIGLSEWLFASVSRLGKITSKDLSPEELEAAKTIDSVHIIDVKADTGFLGHSYFQDSPAASSDLILLLRDDRDPGAEHGRPLKQESPFFWSLDDGYPKTRSPDED